MRVSKKLLLLLLALPICVSGQEPKPSSPDDPRSQSSAQMPMPGGDVSEMDHMDMHDIAHMRPRNFVEEIVPHSTSGTTAEPNSTPAPMLMATKASWQFMFHANVFISDLHQSGPRGADRFFSTNWFMGMAQHRAGAGTFTARAMLSLEPATVTDRRYPLLFQQGETAFGLPILDGQHPHDFIMELAALYDLKLGEQSLLSFYAAPMGDPAIGPTSYPHRASAIENPVGTLGHHQQDSTHIAADVITVGFAHRFARLEVSGFHGREPDEFRWDINSGKIDSWSTRLTIQPGKNWSGQYSYARIASPEAVFATEDQERMTASIMYNRRFTSGRFGDGNWASTVLWGRTRSLLDGAIFNSYLFESTLRFITRNYVWTRIENADRSNELILGGQPLPPGFREEPIGRVQAYTIGYSHDIDVVPHLASALGVQLTAYGVPDSLQPIYGAHPFGVVMFLRLRPFSGER
jgi:hypothetical protein